MAVQSSSTFIEPSAFASAPVYDLLVAASKGHTGIDQRFIRAILDRGPAAVPDLVRFSLEDRSADPVNLEEDLIALFRVLKSPEALPFYLRCIRENPEEVPDDIVDAVIPFGAQALEPLLKLHDELGEDQAGDVAFLLSALGVRDDRILKILVDRLEYDAGDGAITLGVYRDPAALPALRSMLDQLDSQQDESLRRDILQAIDDLENPTPEPATEIEPEPFDIWELYPETNTPPVESLTEAELQDLLNSGDAEYRTEAARAFRNRSEYSASVRDRLLLIARNDPDAAVRGAAWEALGEKINEPSIKDALRKAVGDDSLTNAERTGALVGLAGLSDDPKVSAQIRAFYGKPETRAKALEAMWRSFDRQFAEIFPKHLDDPDPETRRAAIWGVGYLGTPSLTGRLEKMFTDEEYRSDALFAYSLLVPGEVSHARIPGLFRKINEVSGGLTFMEAELVQTALDQRLVMHGLDPYFGGDDAEDWDEEAEDVPPPAESKPGAAKAGRNDPCPCGSGKKYKKCHGA